MTEELLPTEQQPMVPPAPAIPPPKKHYGMFAGVFILGVLIATFFYVRSTRTPLSEQEVVATPTEIPTPTPTPNVSRIATTSAFSSFRQEIASYSATLDAFPIQDSTLAAPTFDTDLGLD